VQLITVFLNNQLDAQFFSLYLFQFSTCFEQPSAHHRESQLNQYDLLYMSLWNQLNGPKLQTFVLKWVVLLTHFKINVCNFGPFNCFLSDIFQRSYWFNWLSWWWALGCSKHVENWNKKKRILRQAGYLRRMNDSAFWSVTPWSLRDIYQFPEGIRRLLPQCLSDCTLSRNSKGKGPVTGLEWPRGFEEVKVPWLHINGKGWC